MELRQLRYFIRSVELGSISQAALDLGVAQSAVSLQIQRLEGELSARLLQRLPGGIAPTDAGLAFLSHARLALRHADEAMDAARLARLSGLVRVGLAPTTARVLGLPLLSAMRERYPDIRVHLMEGMSGHLGEMLNARELDVAILFDGTQARRWQVTPLLDERLFYVRARESTAGALPDSLAALGDYPLVVPTQRHGLRRTIDLACQQLGVSPVIAAEVDSLHVLMEMVCAGGVASLQPWSALHRQSAAADRLCWVQMADEAMNRRNLLCSLSDDELGPAGIAARNTLRTVVGRLVTDGAWRGVTAISDRDGAISPPHGGNGAGRG